MITYEQRLDSDLDYALREGSMHFEENNAVHKTLRGITSRLNDLGIPYAVVGGMASRSPPSSAAVRQSMFRRRSAPVMAAGTWWSM